MMNKSFLIAALDCYGVPYTPDNAEHKSYSDMVAGELRDSGIQIDYVNMHSIAFNKTWELKQLLDKNYTKGQYYKMNQKLATEVIKKSSRFEHPVHPDFLNLYYSNIENPALPITSTLEQSKEPIFLYSCGGMNLDYYLNCPTGSVKKIIPQFLFHLKSNLERTMNDIEQTLLYIKNLNPRTKIYVLGVYPMIEQKFLREILQEAYKIYNSKLESICNKYDNIYYVDVFGNKEYVAKHDNHPNYKGQCYMKKQVLNSIYHNQ